MKLDRTTLFALIGIIIVIVIFNIVTREGFYEDVVVSGTGLSVGPITGKPSATPTASKPRAARSRAARATTKSSAIDLPAATVTVQPAAPLTQVGSLGMQPIITQQVTDTAGTNAVSGIQNKVVSTDSMPGAIAPTRGSCMGPTMGPSSCKDSMDSCDDCDGCDDGCNKSSYF